MNNYFKIGFSVLRLVTLPMFNFLTLTLGFYFVGQKNWGEFVSVSLWIYFLAFLLKWSGQNYMIKEFSKNPSKIYSLFYSNLIERSLFLIPGLVLFFVFPKPVALASFLFLLLLHIYNSFDSLLVYYQKFSLQFLIELIGFCTVVFGLYAMKTASVNLIIYWFCISLFIKIVLLLLFFRSALTKTALEINWSNIYLTLPFFLIGFSGWLASKVDLYVVNYYFTKEKLAAYQLLATSFLMLQSVSGYLIMPFHKHLFRLPKKTIHKIKSKLALAAFPLIAVSGIGIWLFLEKIMMLHFSVSFYILGALSAIPSFYYAVDIMQLYRKNKEKTIVKLCFICIIISLLSMILFIPVFDIFGVLFSVFLTQWLYLFILKREIKRALL